MATYTPNLNLIKPAGTDYYNISDHNANMDALDTAVASKETPAGAQAKVDMHANVLSIHGRWNNISIYGDTQNPDTTTNPHIISIAANSPVGVAKFFLYSTLFYGDVISQGTAANAVQIGIPYRDSDGKNMYFRNRFNGTWTSWKKLIIQDDFLGTDNTSLVKAKNLVLMIDTRSVVATAWHSSGKPTHIDIKDGATVLATIDTTYNSDGNPTQIITADNPVTVTITETITWSGNQFVSSTKVVT